MTNEQNSLKKGLLWKFFDQFSVQIVQFAIGIVMARLLSPSDYGVTALPVVFMLVADALIDGGFTIGLIRKPDLTEKDLSTCFYYSITIGLLLYIIIYCLAPLIARFYNVPILVSLIRVTSLSLIWGPFATPQRIILNRKLDFKTPARINILTKIVSGVFGIVIAYQGYGFWALVLSGLLSSFLSLLLTMIAVRWVPRERFSKESFHYLWNFGNKLLASRLLDTLYANISPIIIGKFYSPELLGIYNRAQGYANLPSVNIANTIQSVSFPALSRLQHDNASLEREYNRLIHLSAFVVFPIMLMLSALAKPLIVFMITEKWLDCVLLLQIMCFTLMWAPISYLNCNIIQVKGRSDIILKLDVKKKVVGLLLMCISLPFGLVAFCVANFFSMMYTIYVNLSAVGTLLNMGYVKQMKLIAPIFLLSFVMFVSILGICSLFDSYLLQIVVGSISGGFIYLCGAYLLRFSEMDYLVHLFNRKS